MVLTEAKFRLSKIVLSAVFISLCACVATAAESARQCYWCGPLAEQVHRSQRAPACTANYPGKVTVCDPGFSYCAIVATSPPYMESRYCVKLYQDECYTLFCNSTKTWRMTCPCRGNLCNGFNTDREEDAFAGLAKLVARTQNMRHKRALISSASFISMNTNRKNQLDNATVEENKNISSNMIDTDIDESDNESQGTDTNSSEENDMENKATEPTVTVEGEIKVYEEPVTNANVVTTETINENTEGHVNTVQEATTAGGEETVKDDASEMHPATIQIEIPPVYIESDDLKTEIIVMSSEIPKAENEAKVVTENIQEIKSTEVIIKETPMEPKTIADTTTEAAKMTTANVKVVENKVKPTEQLPTAEALQHNDSPTTKVTEQTTISSTTMTGQITVPTLQTNSSLNNTAIRFDAHLLPLAIGIILYF